MTKKLEKTYRDMLNEDEILDEAKKAVKEQGGLNQSDNEEGEKDVKEDIKEAKKMKKEAEDDIIDDDDEELEEGNEGELNKKLKVGQNKVSDSKTKGSTPKQENEDPESLTMKEEKDEDDAEDEDGDDKKDKKENPFAKKEAKEEKLKESLEAQAKEASAEMGSLLEGQDLQEDHKDQVKTLFETALSDRTRMIKESLEAQFEADLSEAIETSETALVESLDKYLDKVVNEWMEENKLAVEGGVKAEITESFLTSMKTVFEDHYVDVPEEKMDIVENVIEENEDLEAKLNEEMKLRMESEAELASFRKSAIVEELSEGLTLTEKERLVELSEDVDYGDAETFVKKVKTIKENFIKNVPVDGDTEILNEDAPALKEKAPTDAVTQRYMSAISGMSENKFDMKDHG